MKHRILSWLARELLPYLEPIIAARVAEQTQASRAETRPQRRYIGS